MIQSDQFESAFHLTYNAGSELSARGKSGLTSHTSSTIAMNWFKQNYLNAGLTRIRINKNFDLIHKAMKTRRSKTKRQFKCPGRGYHKSGKQCLNSWSKWWLKPPRGEIKQKVLFKTNVVRQKHAILTCYQKVCRRKIYLKCRKSI